MIMFCLRTTNKKDQYFFDQNIHSLRFHHENGFKIDNKKID